MICHRNKLLINGHLLRSFHLLFSFLFPFLSSISLTKPSSYLLIPAKPEKPTVASDPYKTKETFALNKVFCRHFFFLKKKNYDYRSFPHLPVLIPPLNPNFPPKWLPSRASPLWPSLPLLPLKLGTRSRMDRSRFKPRRSNCPPQCLRSPQYQSLQCL